MSTSGPRPPRRPRPSGSARPKGKPRRSGGSRPPRGPSTGERASAVVNNPVVRAVTYWVVVAVGVLLLALWVVSGPVCGISNVTVEGYTGPQAAAVQETAEIVAGTGSMVRVPVGDMRRALTRFPGITDVRVTRDWPRSITVDVTMGEPVAILAVQSGGRYLLSPTGQVMGTAAGVVGLPVIRVATAPPGGVITNPGERAALRFIGWLPPQVAARLRNLRYGGGRLFADMANALEVRIGAPTKLAAKAQALSAVLSQASPESLARAAYLDISNPTRPMLGSKIVPITGEEGGTSTTGGTDTTGGADTSGDGTSGSGDGASTTGDSGIGAGETG